MRFNVAWWLHVLLDEEVYWFELKRWMQMIEQQLRVLRDISERKGGRR
ncbi:MAG: hypothetical protein QXR17_08755 [Candidatus Bathyarchaeia archaeon]